MIDTLKKDCLYLHNDGTIHKVISVEGAAAHVQIYVDDVLTGDYCTDIGDGQMWDTHLAGSLTPLTR